MHIVYQNNESFEQIKSILAGFTDKRTLNKVEIYSSINKDVGLHGDDAYDFIIEYVKFFDVDISGFVFTDYFIEEGLNLLGIFTRPKKLKPLTVEQLVNASYTKVLI